MTRLTPGLHAIGMDAWSSRLQCQGWGIPRAGQPRSKRPGVKYGFACKIRIPMVCCSVRCVAELSLPPHVSISLPSPSPSPSLSLSHSQSLYLSQSLPSSLSLSLSPYYQPVYLSIYLSLSHVWRPRCLQLDLPISSPSSLDTMRMAHFDGSCISSRGSAKRLQDLLENRLEAGTAAAPVVQRLINGAGALELISPRLNPRRAGHHKGNHVHDQHHGLGSGYHNCCSHCHVARSTRACNPPHASHITSSAAASSKGTFLKVAAWSLSGPALALSRGIMCQTEICARPPNFLFNQFCQPKPATDFPEPTQAEHVTVGKSAANLVRMTCPKELPYDSTCLYAQITATGQPRASQKHLKGRGRE